MLKELTIMATAALALAAGSAGAAPLGAITEFSSGLNPGANPAQVQAGPDGNLWFSDRAGAIGRITPDGTITEFSNGLNPGASDQSIAMGPDGNMWFSDNGTTKAVGMINPTTHAISEFSSGLNAGSSPGGIVTGPDGNLWFADKGITPAIGMINPTTHAIAEFSSGLNAGSLPGGIWTGPDGNVWFTDQGTIRAIGRIGVGAPAASVTPPALTGSGGVGVPQACGADVWSAWAGQQPSHSAFGFDGYQWLLDGSPIAGQTGPSYTP